MEKTKAQGARDGFADTEADQPSHYSFKRKIIPASGFYILRLAAAFNKTFFTDIPLPATGTLIQEALWDKRFIHTGSGWE